MLRITVQDTPDRVHFKLEGKLAGAWVDELERTWYRESVDTRAKDLVIDLCDVTSIDEEGKKLLGWMSDRGAHLRASGCLNQFIAEEIRREHPGPRGVKSERLGGA